MTLKERWVFATQGLQIIWHPIKIRLDNGKKLEFFRCQEDGKLVTDAMGSSLQHLGHRLVPCFCLRWHEWLRVTLGMIPT